MPKRRTTRLDRNFDALLRGTIDRFATWRRERLAKRRRMLGNPNARIPKNVILEAILGFAASSVTHMIVRLGDSEWDAVRNHIFRWLDAKRQGRRDRQAYQWLRGRVRKKRILDITLQLAENLFIRLRKVRPGKPIIEEPERVVARGRTLTARADIVLPPPPRNGTATSKQFAVHAKKYLKKVNCPAAQYILDNAEKMFLETQARFDLVKDGVKRELMEKRHIFNRFGSRRMREIRAGVTANVLSEFEWRGVRGLGQKREKINTLLSRFLQEKEGKETRKRFYRNLCATLGRNREELALVMLDFATEMRKRLE